MVFQDEEVENNWLCTIFFAIQLDSSPMFYAYQGFPLLVICIFMPCVFVEAVTTLNPNTNHFQNLKQPIFQGCLFSECFIQ